MSLLLFAFRDLRYFPFRLCLAPDLLQKIAFYLFDVLRGMQPDYDGVGAHFATFKEISLRSFAPIALVWLGLRSNSNVLREAVRERMN